MDGLLIKSKIEQKLLGLGRAKDSLRIVAVSKTQNIEAIEALHSKGFEVFGENYSQEALPKVKKHPEWEWHFIGSIQTNKLKDIVGHFKLIHSVDRLSVLEKISKIALDKNVKQEILLQVNFSKEPTKSGFLEEDLIKNFAQILNTKAVVIRGLMVFPPPDDLEASRNDFRKGKKLLDSLQKQMDPNIYKNKVFNELSMGTSHDYDIAIEEGSTLLRLGTVLFGQRK